MKVLLISHNVLSRTSSMGKTLLKYFETWKPGEIAQLYIHSEVPTDDSVCTDYFRITDREAIRSLLPGIQPGRALSREEIETARSDSRTDTGLTGQIYQKGRARTPLIYLMRDSAWHLSRWFTKRLKDWLISFSPDVIFLASGDYCFIYEIAEKVASFLKKPLVVACMDDFYCYDGNAARALGRFRQKRFLQVARRTIARASALVTVCEEMAEAYGELFGKPCHVLYTPAEERTLDFDENPTSFAYFGSLGLGRDRQLVALGRALKRCAGAGVPEKIDLYSDEKRPEILKNLTAENGICFHPAVSAEEMLERMRHCAGVIHVESFAPEIRARTRFSISTKIAESLQYGPCLFAYGPAEVASIRYLERTGSACVVTEEAQLEGALKAFFNDPALREGILRSARETAARNHSVAQNGAQLREWLAQAIECAQ